MIDPTSINFLTLPSVALEERSQLPEVSCIYFAIDSLGAVQYIGRSTNVRRRWVKNHHHFEKLTKIGGVQISYLYCEPELLPDIENALIKWFNPPLNTLRQGCNKLSPEKRNRNKYPLIRIHSHLAAQLVEDPKDLQVAVNSLLARHLNITLKFRKKH